MKRLSSILGLVFASGMVLFATTSIAAEPSASPTLLLAVADAQVCAPAPAHVDDMVMMMLTPAVEITTCDPIVLAATDLCIVRPIERPGFVLVRETPQPQGWSAEPCPFARSPIG